MASLHFDPALRTALYSIQKLNDDVTAMRRAASTGTSVPSARDRPAIWAVSSRINADIAANAVRLQSVLVEQATTNTIVATVAALLRFSESQRGILFDAQAPGADIGQLQRDYDAITEQAAALQSSDLYADAVERYALSTGVMISAQDSADTDQDVALTGTTQWSYVDTPSPTLPAIEQDGLSGDGLEFAPVTLTSSVSLGAWARIDDVSGKKFQRVIQLNSPGESLLVTLVQGSSSNDMQLRYHTASGAQKILSAPNAIVEGEWAHWSATIDENGEASMYKDGVLLVSSALGQVASGERTTLVFTNGTHAVSTVDGAVANPFVLVDQSLDQESATGIYEGAFSPVDPTIDNALDGYAAAYVDQVISDLGTDVLTHADPVAQEFISLLGNSSLIGGGVFSHEHIGQVLESLALRPDTLELGLSLVESQSSFLVDVTAAVQREQSGFDRYAERLRLNSGVLRNAQDPITGVDIAALAGQLSQADFRLEATRYAMNASIVRWQNVLQLFRF